MTARYRLAVFNSHPIQYFAPLYKKLAAQDDIDLTVFYGSRQGVERGRVDDGFSTEVVWDVPLLEGYRHEFLANLRGDRGVNGFFTQIIPSIVTRIGKGRFDALIIHGHNSATNLLAIAAAKMAGVGVFMRGETHLMLERPGLKRAIRGPLMRTLYQLCDACLYIGSLNRAFYEAHGVGAGRLFFVPYTVDNDRFMQRADASRISRGEMRRSLQVPEDAVLILFASKLIARKRPMDLLEAFARMRSAGLNVELMFVGSGELEKELKGRADVLGVGGVHFTGFVNQRDLPGHFAASDVFVLPSENEPWGLIINEAMCAGLPVVTTHEVGAAADLVRHGETGFVYERGDIAALADRLTTLVQDAPMRARLANNGRDLVRHWSYNQCVEGIRAALQAAGSPRS
jgi:glycosyltransferase involved in cell wall biosynthesis